MCFSGFKLLKAETRLPIWPGLEKRREAPEFDEREALQVHENFQFKKSNLLPHPKPPPSALQPPLPCAMLAVRLLLVENPHKPTHSLHWLYRMHYF